jgi:hypothetical protein
MTRLASEVVVTPLLEIAFTSTAGNGILMFDHGDMEMENVVRSKSGGRSGRAARIGGIHSVEHLPHGEVNSLHASGMSTVHLRGSRGHFWAAWESSTVNIAGGHVDFLHANDSSLINILSGEFEPSARGASRINIFGGMIGSLSAGYSEFDTSMIVVHGSGFNYPLGTILDSAGTLTGRLSNGDPIDADFQIIGNSSILLVPEPGTLAILLIACGLLAGRFRRW